MIPIDSPTIIYDLPHDDYHRDPCVTPSLSAGMIDSLLVAPEKCFHNSSRLNPDWEPPEENTQAKFDIGTVSHVMFLQPEQFDESVEVLDFDDWRKDIAKAKRAIARSEGRTPLLRHQYERILKARARFLRDPVARDAFSGGQAEVSMFWKHSRYGFMCRARADYLPDSHGYIADYKATANADPRQFDAHAFNMKYYRRAAWYLEGARKLCIEGVLDDMPKHYWFVNQEIKAPHLISVCELNEESIELGRRENELACEKFDFCLRHDVWPGYGDKAFLVRLRSNHMSQIEEGLD